MTTEHSEDFTALAKDAGLPTTDAEINSEFETLADDAGLVITNASVIGALWRFVKSVATTPVKWLVDFMISSVLPQCFLKTATGVFLELHAWPYEIERKPAVKALGNIEFTRTDTAGELIVPVGVVVQSITINSHVYSLATTLEVTFADGDATVLAPVEALEEGDAYNLAVNNYTILPETVDGVTSVTNLTTWLTTPGANEETDDELRDRTRNRYTAVTNWHTDAVYKDILAAFEGVTINNIFFEHTAPRGPGSANAYVMFEVSTPDAAFIATMQSEITDKGNHGHGDDLQLFAIPETTHDVVCTVWPVDNLSDTDKTQLLTDVGNMTRCAFRENTN